MFSPHLMQQGETTLTPNLPSHQVSFSVNGEDRTLKAKTQARSAEGNRVYVRHIQ